MKKLHIIILIAASLLSFTLFFGVTFLVRKSEPVVIEPPSNSEGVAVGSQPGALLLGGGNVNIVKSMTEKQLQSLIYDIRQKMQQYKERERELDKQEERIRLASEELSKDIEQLDSLLIELTGIQTSLQQQEDNLTRTILQIDEIEKQNLIKIAERYDKMDVSYASKIMINMVSNNQIDDVAKILYTMSERPSAKVLGEIGNIEPDIATELNKKLKRIETRD